MRLGFLGRMSDLPMNGQMLGSHPGIPTELHRQGHPAGIFFLKIYLHLLYYHSFYLFS